MPPDNASQDQLVPLPLQPDPLPELQTILGELAYGGSFLTVLPQVFRLERGVQFRRAGAAIAPAAQFASLPLFSTISTSAVTPAGLINPALPGLLQIGNVVPNSTTIAFTLTFTETTTGVWEALVTWVTSTVARANNTSAPVPSSQIQCDGLSSSTTYYGYPFLADNGSGIVGWAHDTSSVGTPPIFESAQSGIALALQNLQTRVPLGILSFTTPASGAGSGSGTGGPGAKGGCPIAGTVVEALGKGPCSVALAIQDKWVYVSTEDGHKLIATPNHPVFSEARGKTEIQQLKRGEAIITEDGVSPVKTLEHLTKTDCKLVVSMERGHLFWAGGILSHNIKPGGNLN